MTKRVRSGDYLRLLIPVADLTPDQRYRAAALGTRIETKISGMLERGMDPDRLIASIGKYFPEDVPG
jgi:hypothetical protein